MTLPRPQQARAEGQHKTEQGQVAFAMGGDEIEAGSRQRQGHPVVGLPALTQPDHGEQQGEHHLGLQHQRGHARRHAELHGAEQKGELPEADGTAIGQQPAPRHGGSGDQQDGGKDHPDEAQRPSSSGECPPAPLDGDEVEPQQRMTRAARNLSLVCMRRPSVCGLWQERPKEDEHTPASVGAVKPPGGEQPGNGGKVRFRRRRSAL